ncbi:hypothetical protein JMG10_03400 [Nostoc ellipsosporum NOK]|nr:hypothetical protein [Nostoc ellipsosporum NOK]
MKAILQVVLLSLTGLCSNARSIFIDMSLQDYSFDTRELYAGDKNCFLINALQKDILLDGTYAGNRALVVFQIFGMKKSVLNNISASNCQSLDKFIVEVVLPSLQRDRMQDITNFIGSPNYVESNRLIDTLIVKNKEITTVYSGAIKIDYFNVIPYKQFSPMQANQTLLNTSASITPVSKWVRDSIPIFKADYIDRKIFLQKSDGDLYTFYKVPERNEDSPLSFVFGFIYKDEKGIISIRSKYLERYPPGRLIGETIKSSDEYYTFQ